MSLVFHRLNCKCAWGVLITPPAASLIPCMKCGLAEWCSEKCQNDHEDHKAECTAAQEERSKEREHSHDRAHDFNLPNFEEALTAGSVPYSDDVKCAIMRIVTAWSKGGVDAVILHTSTTQLKERFMPMKFIGHGGNDADDNDELHNIELRYIQSVDTLEKAKSFLNGDSWYEIEVPPDVLSTIADDLCVRNTALLDCDGDKVHDFRARKVVYKTHLAPSPWKKEEKDEGEEVADDPDQVSDENSNDLVTQCWVCEGNDKPDNPLRRDCACTNPTAGFVHLDCLSSHCHKKCESAYREASAPDKVDCRLAWEFCPACNQKFGKELACDLARTWTEKEASRPKDDFRRVFAGK